MTVANFRLTAESMRRFGKSRLMEPGRSPSIFGIPIYPYPRRSTKNKTPILRGGVICDRFGHVERGMFAAHIVRAHFAFLDDAGDRGFQTRGHVGFLEPIEHQLRG